MRLNSEQLDRLSELAIDLAKGLFLASIAVPAISPAATFVVTLRGIFAGCILTYFSLKIIDIKESNR